jgi:hypothetical protein
MRITTEAVLAVLAGLGLAACDSAPAAQAEPVTHDESSAVTAEEVPSALGGDDDDDKKKKKKDAGGSCGPGACG